MNTSGEFDFEDKFQKRSEEKLQQDHFPLLTWINLISR